MTHIYKYIELTGNDARPVASVVWNQFQKQQFSKRFHTKNIQSLHSCAKRANRRSIHLPHCSMETRRRQPFNSQAKQKTESQKNICFNGKSSRSLWSPLCLRWASTTAASITTNSLLLHDSVVGTSSSYIKKGADSKLCKRHSGWDQFCRQTRRSRS